MLLRSCAVVLSLAVLASCATGPQPAAEPEQPPASVREAIDRAAAPLLARRDPALPSLVIGVSRRGQDDWATYGDAGVGPQSLVRVASMTKPLTALLAASWVAEGTISYDGKIGTSSCSKDLLDAFCFHGTPTTYRHLIEHTSGLPLEPDNIAPGFAARDLQDFLARFQLSIEPGQRFRYSTTGYAALGMALERVTRTPYADGLSARVLGPLGLTSMTFAPSADALAPGFEDGILVADPARPAVLWPSGGLAGTPEDLLRLANINLRPNDIPELAEAIRLTHRVSSGIEAFPGSVAGLGWFYFEALDAFWHAGSTHGTANFVMFSPKTQTSIVIVTNTTLPADGRLAGAAFDLLGKLDTLP